MFADASDGAYVHASLTAHANTLEAAPYFLFALLFSGRCPLFALNNAPYRTAYSFVLGLYYPRAAAGLGAVWLVGRFLFTVGYATGQPERRNTSGGIIHNFGTFSNSSRCPHDWSTNAVLPHLLTCDL